MKKILAKIYILAHLSNQGRQIIIDIKQSKKTIFYLLFLVGVILLFAGLYGLSLGAYLGGRQIFYVLIKLPLLFLISLILSVINVFIMDVILGSRLKFTQYLFLVLLVLGITSLALASLAPILYFFILTSKSHDLIILINAGLFGIAGLFGVYAFWVSRKILLPQELKQKRVIAIIVWILIYSFVGLQTAWMLKPWVGLLKPGEKIPFLRQTIKGNVYVEIYRAYGRLIKGNYY